ncbi:beta-lactamase [Nannizzia gypsea CBS 118893]|uniref:Beta-lactamase n=1 Tax=Arthroderma gypseum (strain ATCC MYA-4604 / CBS 118893) TaxID=535722 RepID=E4UX25_ARTGP|nr:beta-lactamase [Nannizzia gypsea CBS 118893]EFR01825.1 beta-lactamase [Nannizzia gypsea CBS 118893]
MLYPRPFTVSCLLWLSLSYAFNHLAAAAAPSVSSPGCVPSGALLPRPTDLGQSQYIKDATKSLSQSLDDAVSGKIKAGWDVANTSFSVALVSPNGGDPRTGILWEYHHLGEKNVNGTKHLDGDSQYLIGSVSKVFSDLLLLKSNVDLHDPVAKYLSQLKNESSPIDWGNISLLSLSEHLSGTPANTIGALQFYFLQPLYLALGFPPLNGNDYPSCGIADLNKGCTPEELLNGLAYSHPVAEPYERPIYSQLSFTLFCLALANNTGKDYAQMLNEQVISPLGLRNTGVSPGDDERAVIPNIEQQGWGAEYGYNAPGGGLYSSSNDLSILVTRILDYSILQSPQKTKKWLQPRSATASLNTLVGQPWEILRTSNMTPKYPHTIDIYGKSGGAPGYISQVNVIDQYGIGVVLSTAGPLDSKAPYIITEAILSAVLPAAEDEARKQAEKFVGEYTNHKSNNAESADYALITLKTSIDNGTGIRLDSLTRNNSDILEGIRKIWSTSLAIVGQLSPEMRVYPTGIEKTVTTDNRSLLEQDWRINFDLLPNVNEKASDLPGLGRLEPLCTSWQTVDWLYYAGVPMDRVVFTIDMETGKVVGVDIPFLRSGLIEKSK